MPHYEESKDMGYLLKSVVSGEILCLEKVLQFNVDL